MEASIVVTRAATPPEEGMPLRVLVPRENRIILLGPQEMPRRSVNPSAITCTAPPAAGTFFSLSSEKNPIQRPSGDQNGYSAPSVPGIEWADTSARGRSHNMELAPGTEAANTMSWPSGDSSN